MADLVLLEDNDDLAELLEILLQSEGHEVRRGRDGIEGLRYIDQRYPQLVVTDLEMPVLDGQSMIYRMFVEDLGRQNIPVIMISAHPALAEIARTMGTPYFLRKPFDPPELFQLIERALHEAVPPRPEL